MNNKFTDRKSPEGSENLDSYRRPNFARPLELKPLDDDKESVSDLNLESFVGLETSSVQSETNRANNSGSEKNNSNGPLGPAARDFPEILASKDRAVDESRKRGLTMSDITPTGAGKDENEALSALRNSAEYRMRDIM